MTNYDLEERERQTTEYLKVYDISVEKKLVGWIHHTKDYTPFVRIISSSHQLDEMAMCEAIKKAGIDNDGSFFSLSDLVFPDSNVSNLKQTEAPK